MKDATFNGFTSEMEKIAAASRNGTKNFWAKKKSAAFLSNVGNAIRQSGKWVGGQVKGVGTNIGETLHKTFTSPLKSTAEGFHHTIQQSLSGSPANKALGVGMLGLQGLGVYQGVKGLAHDDGSGKGRGERLGELVGNTAGGFIGAKHGISGGIVGGEVAKRGLGTVGKGADKVIAMLRRKPEHVPMPQGQVQG